MSAIREAYVMFNGQKVVATYNEDTGLYEAITNAPAASSWSQPNHVYLAEVHAVDAAGNEASVDSNDADYGDQLKIRVLETTKPTAQITKPSEGNVLGASTQEIVLQIQDAGGSGLNMSSVVFKINNTAVTDTLTWTDGSDGLKTCTYTANNLPDGANKVELQVTDNDGNVSDNAVVNFVISTAAPTLEVNSPTDNLLTASPTLTVSGTAAVGSDSVTLAGVTVNGEAVTVAGNGTFSTEVTLTEGANTITIVATDSLGKTTTITRRVTLDTTKPIISDVVAEATTVNAGGQVKITFRVTDAS